MSGSADDVSAKRRPSRWHGPFWLLNGLAVIALLLAYLSIHISPRTFWPIAFFGMAYPFILGANVLFLLWWAIFRRKRMIPSLVAMLLGWVYMGEYIQLMGHRDQPKDIHAPFKVMSWNVRIFDLYNWNHNKRTREEMLDLIRVEDPISCACRNSSTRTRAKILRYVNNC